MEDDFKIELVNDIGVIMRIQGREFTAAEIYEPEQEGGMLSVSTQRIIHHLQGKGASVLGRMLANSALQVVESDLGRRLQRDKWLIAVIASFTRNLNPKQNALEAKQHSTTVAYVPVDKASPIPMSLIRRAVADVNSHTRGA